MTPSQMKRLLTIFGAFACCASAQRMDEYALVLAGAPVLDRPAARSAARLARVEGAQRGVRGELIRRKLAYTGSVQVLANAVFTATTPARAAELRSIPGVI